MRLAAIFLVVAGLVVVSPGRAAYAADPPLKAELVGFPEWLGPTGDLQATLRVTNNGSSSLSGLRVHVEGYEGPGSRSALQDQFDGKSLNPVWSDTQNYTDALAPGETRDVVFDRRSPMSTLSFFQSGASGQSVPDRAYTLRFSVSAGGFSAAEVYTQLPFFTENPAVDHPLKISLVIPLDVETVFDSQNREVSRSLESAIAPNGRISRILGALEDPRHAEVALGLAPSGRFLDALATLSSPNGFVRQTASGSQQVPPSDPVAQAAGFTIQRLVHLAARPGVAMIATPYANAPLAGLAASGLDKDVQAQVALGRAEIKTRLGYDALPGWLLPTDGLVDDSTLNLLTDGGVEHAILSPPSLRQSPPPVLTPGAQVTVKGKFGSMGALVQDSVLSSRLQGDNGLSPVQVRQRFLAESATILNERPAMQRSIAIVAPSDWAPDPVVVGGIFDALAPTGSPWMTGARPDDVLAQGKDAAQGKDTVQTVSQNAADAGPQTPSKDYFEALRTARRTLDDFAALQPTLAVGNGPNGPSVQTLIDQLTRHLLDAESEEWWGRGPTPDRGKALARSVSSGLQGQLRKIRIQSRNQTITLTSRGATIPLVLESGVNYPVLVVIKLTSDKVEFQGGQPCFDPQGPATCLTKVLLPRAQTIQVRAKSKFSGSFQVKVALRSVPGLQIAQARLLIRSTAYNLLALSIMGAAALFILLSWLGGIARRRMAVSLAGAPVD
jgi:hypothetical protein